MDRLSQESFLRDLEPGPCDPMAIVAPTLYGSNPAAPSPQERLARIVRTIENDIIPRLIRAHRHVVEPLPAAVPSTPSYAEVQAFVQLLLAADDAGWHVMIEGITSRGVQIDDIYIGLLGPAAAELGRCWDDDLCSFTDVTVMVTTASPLSTVPSFTL